jgi:hypothetical protein
MFWMCLLRSIVVDVLTLLLCLLPSDEFVHGIGKTEKADESIDTFIGQETRKRRDPIGMKCSARLTL